MIDRNQVIASQLKYAIEARDRLQDNYHKWMSYYYIANAAVLVAITTLFGKNEFDRGVLVLALIGVFVCILWNLSCKGYYYWAKNWIHIIIKLERQILRETYNYDLAVYSTFSEEVATNDDSVLIPTKAANISTPKLTLLFSYFSILAWLIYSGYCFFMLYTGWPLLAKLLILLLSIFAMIMFYTILLPKWTKSRYDAVHDLRRMTSDCR